MLEHFGYKYSKLLICQQLQVYQENLENQEFVFAQITSIIIYFCPFILSCVC